MKNYNCIDLNLIKENVSEYAFIKEAKEYILNEEITFNPLVIKKKSLETREAFNLLNDNFVIHFDGIENINHLLDQSNKNLCLDGNELRRLLTFHYHSKRIKSLFDKLDLELSIKDYSDSININDTVFDKIEKCIDNSGQVKDDATEKLKNINNEIINVDKDLYNRAHHFIDKHTSSLQEQSIYLRDDRVCFLIKNSDKNKFNGYTYGTSSSGLACYVEPSGLIELNNKKINLLHDKEDEIKRILMHLTYLISSISDSYYSNFDNLSMLCVIFAKARYGLERHGIVPEFTNNKYFDFKDLCHPLIDSNKVVSNNYRVFTPYRGIVISGTNTGGKTVSLKAIGISIVMSYLGIPIIASSANIPLYENIFVDIDDNQSIQDSLSTFSSHITNINNILKQANDRCLILIDELISGTDPKEAQAISLAILDKIKELGSTFIITTHFDDIKKYSYENECILLSSVGFDMDNLKPTYKYIEDSIGASNAIDIASRYFDDKDLIENARNYLKANRSKQDELLDKLSRQISDYELKNKINDEYNHSLELKIKEYEDNLAKFDKEKDILKKEYENKLIEYIEDIKAKAIEKLDNIKEKDSKVVKQIEDLVEDIEIEKPEIRELKVSDNVRIIDNEQVGEIVSINKDIATVNIRGLSVKVKLCDLTYMPKVNKTKPKVISKSYKRLPMELNLVGERVEDGLVMAEEYLDKANAAHMKTVKIIHGIGTGALRSAIRNRLKKLSYIKSFKDGDYYDGSSAVTIVEFK